MITLRDVALSCGERVDGFGPFTAAAMSAGTGFERDLWQG